MPKTVLSVFETIGVYALAWWERTKYIGQFFVQIFYTLFACPPTIRSIIEQIALIGVSSLPIALLTGTFSGMVFALQTYVGFSRIGGQQFIGSVVALGMARELGPVMTGLMVTGRACSAIAAEIGTMKISEQLDALKTLRVNLYSYLIAPRVIAAVIALPCLSIFSVVSGIIGGYVVMVHVLGLSGEQYITNITQMCTIHDVMSGCIKALFFGLILSIVGCYKGLTTKHGARGVGRATTQAVVLSSVFILMSNYFLTKYIDQL